MSLLLASPADLIQISAAAPPPAGSTRFYAKADGKLYSQDPAGTETQLGGSSGGGGAMPQVPTAGFTVAANTQQMFFTDMDMTAANGDLIVNGLLQGIH